MTEGRAQTHGVYWWPLAVGAVAAAALILTALLDFGDPLRSAQDEVELGAAARADAVRATWARLRADGAGLVEPMDGFDVLVPEAVAGFAAAARTGDSEAAGSAAAPVAWAMARAARAARLRGEVERAEELAAVAAERARGKDPGLLARVQLDRCRWAGARGDDAAVKAIRASLLADGDAAALAEGTSVRLLAAMVPPVDVELAREALAAGAGDGSVLPVPEDRVLVRANGGGVDLVWDAWWSTLEARLTEAATPGENWAGLFQRDERRAEAVRRLFGGRLGGSLEQWTLTRRGAGNSGGGGLFAVRRVAGGTRVLATYKSDVVARLAAEIGESAGERSAYRVSFDGAALGDRVREREDLEGDWLGFTVHREDAYGVGRSEAARLAAVRAGLVILAVAILCAAMLATRALHRTRRLERVRSTFVASVTHDLRTPIQSILLMSETLERGKVAREASRARYFATIRQEAQRLRRFVEDVLDSARMDRGEGARIARQTVESEELFAAMEHDLQQRATRDGASVDFVRGRLPEQLELDPDGTLRIAWNLFENALRYGRVDGKPATVRVEVGFDDDVLSIVVHDQGPGVPARFAKRIFDPFERALAEEGGPTGTGLGLSIVRALAQAHGGDAELLPSEQGARFEARIVTSDSTRQGDPAA